MSAQLDIVLISQSPAHSPLSQVAGRPPLLDWIWFGHAMLTKGLLEWLGGMTNLEP